MSDEVLTPQNDAQRPVAGIFGKLPATGDFVWRGLPEAFRKHWDFWLTRHIAHLQRHGHSFPSGGLRFRLPSGGRLAAGVILPSRDKAGRHFPLSLLLLADGDLAPAQIDPWCDAALALHPETLTPDALWQALDALPSPHTIAAASGPMQLWTPGQPPVATDATTPESVLRQLLGTG
ncbi:type VI secretion system-associated protein TagF [Tabrizicola sp.]|uniref:type VI secretion system-associated protein TagF n=1 Tax=Tabrizicola sp. TaxID=2005166 RepID=UPI002732FB75|nr:type VI secretion system-associated protein TagF [Tabrizicola sp.]MDP3195629.1 type VI secretion system-associated protein TagF [Tabrizicola sp.]